MQRADDRGVLRVLLEVALRGFPIWSQIGSGVGLPPVASVSIPKLNVIATVGPRKSCAMRSLRKASAAGG